MPTHDYDIIETLPAVPERPEPGHKGTFGTVVVVGGCDTMMGAPALCARSAFRCGTGLVKIASVQAVLPVAIGIEPSATGICLSGDAMEDVAQLEAVHRDGTAVLALGPGLGQAQEARELVEALIAKPWPMVIDADGLNHLANLRIGSCAAGEAPRILTPHPGEFARLAQVADISESAVDAQQRPIAAVKLSIAQQAVVVLKGRNTVVADGQRVYINTTGSAVLATAGTGDVLTGAIASLLAQGMTPFDAAVLGVYLHGAAGDIWTAAHGPSGLRAIELADALPEAMQQHREGITHQ